MRCAYCNKNKATSLIRTFDVCGKCFDIFKRDNIRRLDMRIRNRDSKEIIQQKKFIIRNKLNNIPNTLILLDDEVRFKKLLKKQRNLNF